MNDVIEAIAATAMLTGTELTPAAAKMLAMDLSEYEPQQVMTALARCRRELTGRLTLAAILERIDSGFPGAEEAWAMMPKDENESACITEQMGAAWGVACGLYDDGDKVGARMAFREAYEREVRAAKEARQRVTWFLSAGYDRAGREAAAIAGLRLKRIGVNTALEYIEPERQVLALRSAGVKDHPLLAAPSNSEAGMKLLAEVAAKLSGKTVQNL